MAKGQTQTLYSLAAVLGLVESGNKEDPFHMIVYRISGKTSVRELTPPEAAAVEAERQWSSWKPRYRRTVSRSLPVSARTNVLTCEVLHGTQKAF